MLRYLALVLILAVHPATAEERVPQSPAEITLTFAPLVREAAPAVVNIYASRVVQSRSPFADDPLFGQFFREFAPARPRVQNSLGSGVILSEDGIVVSNYHVVGEAEDIRVVMSDRREYAARVLLGDEESDLAILKLEGAEDMPHLTLRQDAPVEVGGFRSWRSATRSGSVKRSRRGSYLASRARARRRAMHAVISSRPTPRSIRAIRAVPSLTWRAASSA